MFDSILSNCITEHGCMCVAIQVTGQTQTVPVVRWVKNLMPFFNIPKISSIHVNVCLMYKPGMHMHAS